MSEPMGVFSILKQWGNPGENDPEWGDFAARIIRNTDGLFYFECVGPGDDEWEWIELPDLAMDALLTTIKSESALREEVAAEREEKERLAMVMRSEINFLTDEDKYQKAKRGQLMREVAALKKKLAAAMDVIEAADVLNLLAIGAVYGTLGKAPKDAEVDVLHSFYKKRAALAAMGDEDA